MEVAPLPLLFLVLLPAVVASVGETAHPGYAHAECGVASPALPERQEEFDGGRIVDISHYYRDDMPAWESGEGVGEFLRLARSMSNGSDIANFSELRLTAHSGTHVDAPGHVFQHYYDAGFDVDTLDLAVLNGPALLVDVPRDKNITAIVMESLRIPKGVRRVLFRTLNTDRKLMWKKEFDTSYVGFMEDGAQWLVDNTDIKLVGNHPCGSLEPGACYPWNIHFALLATKVAWG
ncbi:cyclase-like protein 4 isoform X2 [Phragmites australis]|uniref:cyclase-like protein 4 isoform X2 n=1 Tax=Phragmites australis TaxID=29695 RepID=UPI002D7A399E|nr:cyclase-like protein 4 isoform X2 [Phragmites australis]